MQLLLDTHVLLGLFDSARARYDEAVAELLESPEHQFLVSVASLWEIAIKVRLGKLELTVPLADLPREVGRLRCSVLPVSPEQAIAEVLPWPPTNDPIDRLLLAVCAVLDAQLVTDDAKLRDHSLAWRPRPSA